MADLAELLQQIQLIDGGAIPARTVPVPTQTLGGRRMQGARPMTVQEQTMLAQPWVQMGRDAGALGSFTVNTAGFGLPGVALDGLSPETLAAIRENETLANAGITATGTAAGIAAAPYGAVMRGAETLGRGIASLPTWAKLAGVGVPALGAPTEAGSPEVAAKDYEPPSLAREGAAANTGRVPRPAPTTQSYSAIGPGTFYVLPQFNNTSARFNTHTFGNFGASKKTGETFGTFTTVTPPTTFTTALGPIATLY